MYYLREPGKSPSDNVLGGLKYRQAYATFVVNIIRAYEEKKIYANERQSDTWIIKIYGNFEDIVLILVFPPQHIICKGV